MCILYAPSDKKNQNSDKHIWGFCIFADKQLYNLRNPLNEAKRKAIDFPYRQPRADFRSKTFFYIYKIDKIILIIWTK